MYYLINNISALLFLALICDGHVISLDERVIGGNGTNITDFPYMVSFRNNLNDKHFCGGSIIKENVILSAAHCFDTLKEINITVVTGTNSTVKGGVRFTVKKIIQHKNWLRKTYENDIAVVYINEKIVYNNKMAPICFERKPQEGVCDLLGWGRTAVGAPGAEILQRILVPTIDKTECFISLSDQKLKVRDSNICTFLTVNRGGCQGDSGGPLVNAQGFQIGIVSWGVPCATGKPDVYTRVGFYYDWITKNAGVKGC